VWLVYLKHEHYACQGVNLYSPYQLTRLFLICCTGCGYQENKKKAE